MRVCTKGGEQILPVRLPEKRGKNVEKFRDSELKRRILVVDDEFINREILSNILSKNYDVYTAEDGEQAYEMLCNSDTNFSLCLLDLLMPKMDGHELIAKLQKREPPCNVPIIVLTSEKDAEVTSIRMGAADFITKPYVPEVVIARAERIIELFEGQKIIQSTERDSLTDLYTKDYFFAYIREIEEYQRENSVDAVVLTVDHLNLIKECYGRKTADDVLRRIADFLPGVFGELGEIGCRAEEDVFYIYCRHQDNYEEVLEQIQKRFSGEDKGPRIRIRLGVYPETGFELDAETRYSRAKAACDQIRADYTNHVSYYSEELREKSVYEERLVVDFDDSVENKDFKVFYQPKYDVSGDMPRLCSAEALVRWVHPGFGMISPGVFVPLFEKNGLVQKLDHYVWGEAASQIKKWKEEFGITVPVSVNVSRIDIFDENIEEHLLNLLKENNLGCDEMLLEVTESAYADDAERLVELVNNLRNRGFKIEMDDFGSGYSSLNMLATIPVDVLKMDMKFIQNMLKDEKSLKLVKLILDIAEFLHIPVVAEGVEEEAQMKALKEMGCKIIQGYYFSKPLPPEEFAELIKKEKERSGQ